MTALPPTLPGTTTGPVRWQPGPDLLVEGDRYRLRVRGGASSLPARPFAELEDRTGRRWLQICLLAGADGESRDETWEICSATAEPDGDDLVVALEQRSTVWDGRRVELRCRAAGVELTMTVTGSGPLGRVTLLGGNGRLPTGAAGTFRSGVDAGSLYVPGPTEPVAFVRRPREPAQLGVVGDADPGRLHGIFSPPPFALGLGRAAPDSVTQPPDGDWLALHLRADPRRCGFTQLRWSPLDGGALLELDHEGHTRVEGEWRSPTLVLTPVPTALDVLRTHRDDLVMHGLAPAGTPRPVVSWWRQPLFCGWGAQVELGDAARRSRADRYDDWLTTIADAGLDPGTVVVDDRWEARYGSGEPDPEQWPQMRAWIDEQHRRGRRVLLWWKCWDPAAAPAEECITTPTGSPVAVDPASPAYRRRLRRTIASMLGAEGLDADGLKVDFSQRAPSGATLLRAPDADSEAWGVAALHLLLTEIYEAAVAARPDALVITHAVHPGFAGCADMIRTNDVLERDADGEAVPVSEQLRARAAIVSASLPHHLLDTDQWPMPGRQEWLSYAHEQARLGVPALYYVDSVHGEAIDADDLREVAATWRDYRERL